MSTYPQASTYLMIFTGVFEFNDKIIATLKKSGYRKEDAEPSTKIFFKDSYYPEFRKIMFLPENDDVDARIYKKPFQLPISLGKEVKGEIKFFQNTLHECELFLFPNGIGMFALHFFSTEPCSMESISDFSFLGKNFNTPYKINDETGQWIQYIEDEILAGIKIRGNHIKVDDYSGSKLKTYLVVETEKEISQQEKEHLLYDLGCSVPIGSGAGKTSFTPSADYYQTILQNKISAFNNWEGLALFDSLTFIGNNILNKEQTSFKNATYKQTYFRIFIFNLFLKFSLYRYNSEFQEDSVSIQTRLEKFINNYNISYMSFNFLPNLIFHKHRQALDTEAEIAKFRDRLARIATSVQEEQQKGSNILLTAVSFITTLGSAPVFFSYAEKINNFLGLPPILFYILLAILLLLLGIPVLIFLFPEKWKKLKKKLQPIIEKKREFKLSPERGFHLLRHFERIDDTARNQFRDFGYMEKEIDEQLNMVGSKFSPEFSANPFTLINTLSKTKATEVFSQDENTYVSVFDFTQSHKTIGKDAVINVNSLSLEEKNLLEIEIRSGYEVKVLARHQPLPPTTRIILCSNPDTGEISTCFPGTYAPPFPKATMSGKKYKHAKEFWENHAFIRADKKSN